jgi:Flp pilus assembly protein TadD
MSKEGFVGSRWLGVAALLGVLVLGAGCATSGGSRTAEVETPSAEETLAAGDEAARRGDFERALAYYVRAVGLEPTADGWLRVGAAATRLTQRERALQAYLQVIALDPAQAEAREGAGLELMARGKLDEARVHLAQAVQLEPRRWRSHNGLGVIADQRRDHAAAIAHYEAALALRADSPMVLNNLGYSRFLSGDLTQAARDFYAATRLDGDYKPAWANLGMVYAHEGWYADAIEILTKVSDRATAHNDVGFIAFERGDLTEAEHFLSEAVRLAPTFYETAWRNLQAVRNRIQSDAAAERATGMQRVSTGAPLARAGER